jgi:hypothetical protein
MKQLLLLISFFCWVITTSAQKDSVTAEHLQALVESIESNLEADVELTADTTIIDKDGTMTVHTSYFIDRSSGEVEKIIEKTLFGSVTTEIVVYYHGRSAILFTSKQWQGADLKLDFDYYLEGGSPVYLVKREFSGKGNPNSDEILKWCNEFLKESDNKKALAKNTLIKPSQKTIVTKKSTEVKATDSTKKVSSKKPLLPFFRKKH